MNRNSAGTLVDTGVTESTARAAVGTGFSFTVMVSAEESVSPSLSVTVRTAEYEPATV